MECQRHCKFAGTRAGCIIWSPASCNAFVAFFSKGRLVCPISLRLFSFVFAKNRKRVQFTEVAELRQTVTQQDAMATAELAAFALRATHNPQMPSAYFESYELDLIGSHQVFHRSALKHLLSEISATSSASCTCMPGNENAFFSSCATGTSRQYASHPLEETMRLRIC